MGSIELTVRIELQYRNRHDSAYKLILSVGTQQNPACSRLEYFVHDVLRAFLREPESRSETSNYGCSTKNTLRYDQTFDINPSHCGEITQYQELSVTYR